jgi:DNA mismatch endonuclease, patch repair protein
MSKQSRRDTRPELELRRLLHAAGCRYRVQYPVPGLSRRTNDIAFPARKLAVFVDGCFWHGCGNHSHVPASNHDWWKEKLRRNAARDTETAEHLRGLGWLVVRLWEHQAATEMLARGTTSTRHSRRSASIDTFRADTPGEIDAQQCGMGAAESAHRSSVSMQK